jgi:outer membrane protein OmpA-like peptidoglycan-associated protein
LKSGEVLKRWKTTVVASDNGFGSTIRVAPSVMFSKSSPVAMKNSLSVVVKRVSGARAALVVGHTGILTGNTQENRVLSVKRAKNVSNELKQVAVVSFVGLGGDVPLSTRMSETAQAQNRRVVIYFVP